MTIAELLADAFERIRQEVHHATDGLTAAQLAFRPDSRANSIAWLVWHLTRVQDDHVAGVAGSPQVWTSAGWADRFALPFATSEHGYGHDAAHVAAVKVSSAELLTGYYDGVHAATLAYVATLTDADLDRVVDESWNPPVTLGVRLVSVISDDLQHVGQAAYLRGLIERG
jgi:uncharacterized damage-inducible protein DinB